MNKKNVLKVGAAVLMSFCLVSCGLPAEKIQLAESKYAEMKELYDRVAPTVAKLDDASVEVYDKIGKTVRKAISAADTNYDGYDADDLDKLIVEMDTATTSLKSFEGMQPVESPKLEENKKTYAVSLVNGTEKVFTAVTLKSASGSHDIAVALSGDFVKDGAVSLSAQVPESEAFTVLANDSEGKETAFSGKFYLSAVKKITLTLENEAFVAKVESAGAES